MKNIRLLKKNISIIFCFIFLFCILISTNVYANENEVKDYYSDAYLEYLKLSDEDKAEREVIPEKYEMSVKEYFSKKKDMNLVGEALDIPSKFDLRDIIDIKVEDQGLYGLCWAFASSNTVETNLALNNFGDFDASEMHINYLTSMEFEEKMGLNFTSYRNLHDGGNFTIFYNNYSLLNRGPISEEFVPYVEVAEEDYGSLLNYNAEIYIHETVRFPDITDEDDESVKNQVINDIKSHIMTNGALYASICTYSLYETEDNAVLNEQNKENMYTRDHAITIIGWDDNYSKENFPEWMRPEEDGAYIALNSWGEAFGDNGIFYISYEDILVHGELFGVALANKEPYKMIDIQFEDENLFNTVVNFCESYINCIDVETKTITINESYVKLITNITIYNVENLKGLEYFTELEFLAINNVNISDENNIKILQSFKNLKGLYISETNLEDWSFIKTLNLKELDLWETNFNDFEMIKELELLEIISIHDYSYEEKYEADIDLSECDNLKSVTFSFDQDDYVWITGLNKNIEAVDLSFVHIAASALDECTNLRRLNISNAWTDTLKFITKDFTKLEEIYVTGLTVDITPISNLTQDVDVHLYNMEINDIDCLINKENLNVEIQECVFKEYLVEEINVGSKKKIETPKAVTYVYEHFMNNEYYMNADISVINGKITNNLEHIVLDTDEKGVSIPLVINVYNSNYEFENSYFKYIIYYDVVEKEGWFNDYAKITYSTHVENDGWQGYVGNNQIAGTSGRALRLEALKIDLDSNIDGAGIEYSTHIENIGWQNSVFDNELSGTEGQSLRLEAVKIKLSEELDVFYDIYYRVHAQNIGWMNWAKNGEIAGTAGMAYRLEAIQIMIVEEGSSTPIPIPAPNYNFAYKELAHINYNTHVERIGWTPVLRDGIASGSLGSNLRVEAFAANIESSYKGDLYYNAYVQGRGWNEEFPANGDMAGTEGESLQTQAIFMFLTEDLAEKYDIYYRVLLNNENVWQGWTLNGEAAGSYEPGRYIQGIQIVLRDKGGLPPKDTGRPSIIFYEEDIDGDGEVG